MDMTTSPDEGTLHEGVLVLDIDSVEAAVIGPGVTRRLLWDSPTHRVTVIDMEPGATFPYVDTHDTLEETYVVSGQWSEGDRSYGPGAFLHYEPGTSHQPHTCTGGRLFGYRLKS